MTKLKGAAEIETRDQADESDLLAGKKQQESQNPLS